MQSDTISNRNHQGMIDGNAINTTTATSFVQPFKKQQQRQHGLDDTELGFGPTQQQSTNAKPQDSATPEDKRRQLYKTEICRNWEEQGTCRYGSKCQYAHGNQDLRHVHRHPRYKTLHCKTFESTGACPYGRRCMFLHEQTLTSDRSSHGRQHYALSMKQNIPPLPSSSTSDSSPTVFVSGNPPLSSSTRLNSRVNFPLARSVPSTQDATISPYSPPSELSVATSTESSPPSPLPRPSYSFLSGYLNFSTNTNASAIPTLQQCPQQEPNQLDQERIPNMTKSESHFPKDLFTDSGGFSCVFGLSPPLSSPSNSNIPSYFSPSSSTATASSSSSTLSSTHFMADHHHHFFY